MGKQAVFIFTPPKTRSFDCQRPKQLGVFHGQPQVSGCSWRVFAVFLSLFGCFWGAPFTPQAPGTPLAPRDDGGRGDRGDLGGRHGGVRAAFGECLG